MDVVVHYFHQNSIVIDDDAIRGHREWHGSVHPRRVRFRREHGATRASDMRDVRRGLGHDALVERARCREIVDHRFPQRRLPPRFRADYTRDSARQIVRKRGIAECGPVRGETGVRGGIERRSIREGSHVEHRVRVGTGIEGGGIDRELTRRSYPCVNEGIIGREARDGIEGRDNEHVAGWRDIQGGREGDGLGLYAGGI